MKTYGFQKYVPRKVFLKSRTQKTLQLYWYGTNNAIAIKLSLIWPAFEFRKTVDFCLPAGLPTGIDLAPKLLGVYVVLKISFGVFRHMFDMFVDT